MSLKKTILFILRLVALSIASALLTSCISNIWSGATIIYDRHNIYKQLNDCQLAFKTGHTLSKEQFPCRNCSIDVAVFNGDILLVGHVPTNAIRLEAQKRVETLAKHRRIFNELSLDSSGNNAVQDSWITTKIRSQIIADSDIDPRQFKVVTSNQIVYLMGDVLPEEAARVIHIASNCTGVKRVVKLLMYLNLSDKPMNRS